MNLWLNVATRLQKILNEEGITKAAMGRALGLNPTTVHYLCKDPNYHSRTRDLTKMNVVNAIRELGRSNKKYSLDELFPSNTA